MNVAILIATILVTTLFVVSPVYAQTTTTVERVLQDNPYEQNLFGDLSTDVRAKLGQPCTQSGVLPAVIRSALKIFGFSSSSVKTFTDLCNVDSLSSTPVITTGMETDTTSDKSTSMDPELKQDIIDAFYKTDNPGLGAVLIQASTSIIDQRPASGLLYLAEQYDKLTTPSAVYAATTDAAAYYPGLGYSLLYPIRDFWGWAVTISFSFMILIILVIAFGLLFRARLDGKNVVKLENAIPGIVLAMILIPLSYPISGLFIDGITLGTNVVHDVLFSQSGPARMVYEEKLAEPTNNGEENRGLYADDPRVTVLNVRNMIQIGDVVKILEQSCDTSGCNSANLGGTTILGTVASIIRLFNQGSTINEAGLLGDIISFIFSIIFLITCIKIFFRLFKKYLVLLLFPIISPFFFAMIALPGKGTKQIMDFVKIMGNAAAQFVVVYAIFLIAIIFTSDSFLANFGTASTSGYIPPLLDRNIVTILGAGSATVSISSFFIIIGAMLLLAIPGILDSMDKTFKVEGSNPLVSNALKELRTNADIGFRQVPLTVANTAVKGIQGIQQGRDKYLDSLRAPGAATQAEIRQSKGAQRQSEAERQLEIAKESSGPGRTLKIAAAQARVAAAKANNRIQGQQPTQLGEGKSADFKVSISAQSAPDEIFPGVLRVRRSEYDTRTVSGSVNVLVLGGAPQTGLPIQIVLSSDQVLPSGDVSLQRDTGAGWKDDGIVGKDTSTQYLLTYDPVGPTKVEMQTEQKAIKVEPGKKKVTINALIFFTGAKPPAGTVFRYNDKNKIRFRVAGKASQEVKLNVEVTN